MEAPPDHQPLLPLCSTQGHANTNPRQTKAQAPDTIIWSVLCTSSEEPQYLENAQRMAMHKEGEQQQKRTQCANEAAPLEVKLDPGPDRLVWLVLSDIGAIQVVCKDYYPLLDPHIHQPLPVVAVQCRTNCQRMKPGSAQ